MPPLYEVGVIYADSAARYFHLAGLATSTVARSNAAIFPQVETVFGVVGRSDSATDNAPLDMYDTTIMRKPRGAVARGHDVRETDYPDGREVAIPRLTNTWTMPVENRLDMALSGIKTPVG